LLYALTMLVRSLSKFVVPVLSALLLSTAAVAVFACGGGNIVRSAKVAAGSMPANESWNGVFFHPVFGYLHMVEDGEGVAARWKRADQSAWGEMTGKRDGNLVKFSWKEHKLGLVGPGATTEGKGYFLYTEGTEQGTAELKGEYGLGDDEVGGGKWDCVRQLRMKPDLKSINGDSRGLAPAAGSVWR
jgi:hypothetical protein